MESYATSVIYADQLFASVDADLHMQRIAGGNETEVYCTDDEKYVVKVKSEGGDSLKEALKEAQSLRASAYAFTEAIGPEHAIPNYFFIARNTQGEVQPVVVQPYVCNACPLFALDYAALSRAQREELAGQLRQLIHRALAFYRETGEMPDLYGRVSHSNAERRRLNTPLMLPRRMWSFLVQRTLLRSHNLLLTQSPEQRLILVDYDPIKKSELYKFIYYTVRRLLFLRDLALITLMEKTGRVLGAHPPDLQ